MTSQMGPHDYGNTPFAGEDWAGSHSPFYQLLGMIDPMTLYVSIINLFLRGSGVLLAKLHML